MQVWAKEEIIISNLSVNGSEQWKYSGNFIGHEVHNNLHRLQAFIKKKRQHVHIYAVHTSNSRMKKFTVELTAAELPVLA